MSIIHALVVAVPTAVWATTKAAVIWSQRHRVLRIGALTVELTPARNDEPDGPSPSNAAN